MTSPGLTCSPWNYPVGVLDCVRGGEHPWIPISESREQRAESREQRACPERRGLQGEILQACERRYDFLLSELERPVLALGLVTEVLDLMAKGVGQRDEESVVRLAAKIVRQPHFEVRSASQEKEGNIVLAV